MIKKNKKHLFLGAFTIIFVTSSTLDYGIIKPYLLAVDDIISISQYFYLSSNNSFNLTTSYESLPKATERSVKPLLTLFH